MQRQPKTCANARSTDRTPAWFLWLGPASVAFATVGSELSTLKKESLLLQHTVLLHTARKFNDQGLSLDFRTQFNIVAIIFTWTAPHTFDDF